MAYKDKEKQKAYQRDWVRQKRGSTGSTEQMGSTSAPVPIVQPVKSKPGLVRPAGVSDHQWNYIQFKAGY